MDEVTSDCARACGFCNKRICRTCLPHLVEINCEGEADEMGRPLGSAHRGAVYNTARLPHNASFLSDVWLFRLPQTPRQPPVRRDGLPRS